MATQKSIVLITGANQGLGYYAAAQLSATGQHHVLVGSRSQAKGAEAVKKLGSDASAGAIAANLSPIEIDVSSDASIAAAAAQVEQQFGRLDILINNAGISRAAGVHSDVDANPDGSDPPLREQYRQLYDVNVFGIVVAIEAFLPLLRKSTVPGGKRIAFTGSGMASLDRALNSDGPVNGRHYRMYRSTKTALNMIVVSYACELEEEGFVVSGGNPGHCGTNLNLYKGLKDPRDGAKVIVEAALAPKEACHGRLIDEGGKVAW